MKTVTISEFKAKCLALLEQVRRSRRGLVVTRRGQPVAQILPLSTPEPLSRVGHLSGSVREIEDIVEPLPLADWEVER
jgi:prevent-host-death family protein